MAVVGFVGNHGQIPHIRKSQTLQQNSSAQTRRNSDKSAPENILFSFYSPFTTRRSAPPHCAG
ncbi:hypothetical protein CH378_06000 [Leptospira kmetyi]|uniref:Uncharacterized protein n=1 Tax=Leptospira kmetyi TaxID=408139 RepID=A0ABX4NBH4_9LEPT|nr:hypothetical protein CH378_06000 [Leptospira kmetyi]